MSKSQRVINILLAILMIASAVLMIVEPEIGYLIIIAILSLTLFIMGIRYIVYYFSMARHMVGGRMILFIGVIALDMGLFSGTLISVSKIYVVLYLAVTNAFAGTVDVLRAMEARRYQSESWKRSISFGMIYIALAILCLIFLRSTRIIVILYCIGMFYSAAMRIFNAFRRTAIIYIQ